MKFSIALTLISIFFHNECYSTSSLTPLVNASQPSFATIIVQNGKTILKDVKGCTSFSGKKCINKADFHIPFPICSVTKHITVAAILKLEEDGLLSTEDFITKYLELPENFNKIRIKHLIFQISGITSYTDTGQAMNVDSMIEKNQKLNKNKAIEMIAQMKLDEHGKKYNYSNSNYVLLSQIIENVSSMKFENYIRKKIFERFDMKNSLFISEIKKNTKYAKPHTSWPFFKYNNWMEAIEYSGDGGILMSLNDLEKWINAFDAGKIFEKQETMKKYISYGQYDDGSYVSVDKTIYGYGLRHIAMTPDGKTYNALWHYGGMRNSSNAGFVYFKDSKTWIAFMTNGGSAPNIYNLIDAMQSIGINP
jgi:CubicO group peptidase (beta-lactamase class C family)